jgi:cytoskeletal protein CcmA (bactofilin family)
MRIGGGGLTIKGELTAAEDLTIDGTFEGSIDLPGHRLTIAQGSAVNAAVSAEAVTVEGRFDGHLSAARIDITPTAVVDASIVSEHLAVKDGAQVNGAVNTERARAAAEVAKHKRSKP